MTTHQRILAVTINPGLAIVGTLPAVTYNVAYSATLQGYGGVEPYQWSIVSGALPTGLSATTDSNGDFVVSGTTTAVGNYSLGIMLEDSAGRSVTRKFLLRVIALPLVLSGDAPSSVVGSSYTFTYTATGGVPPYTFTKNGNLPPGLSFNSSTGTISGTPTVSGTYPFYIYVNDSQSPMAADGLADTIFIDGASVRITESSDRRITESGNVRILE